MLEVPVMPHWLLILFGRYGSVALSLVVVALAAGVTPVPWLTFLLSNAAGDIGWGTAMAFLGFLFGQSWSLLEHWVGGAGLVLVGLVATAILFAVLRQQRTRIAAWLGE